MNDYTMCWTTAQRQSEITPEAMNGISLFFWRFLASRAQTCIDQAAFVGNSINRIHHHLCQHFSFMQLCMSCCSATLSLLLETAGSTSNGLESNMSHSVSSTKKSCLRVSLLVQSTERHDTAVRQIAPHNNEFSALFRSCSAG